MITVVSFWSTPTLQTGSALRQGSLHAKVMKTGELHQWKYLSQLCLLWLYSHSSSSGYTETSLAKSCCRAWLCASCLFRSPCSLLGELSYSPSCLVSKVQQRREIFGGQHWASRRRGPEEVCGVTGWLLLQLQQRQLPQPLVPAVTPGSGSPCWHAVVGCSR